jgi:NNP family nitrate/nitrite transporter-like MFS transporter
MPEETVHYLRQIASPGWKALFLLNLFLNWVIPFVILISRNAKRRETILLAACSIVLVGHWVDLHQTIFPVFGWPVSFNLIDIALPLGFASVFLLSFVKGVEKTSLLPVNDPYLEESLALHPEHTNSGKAGWDREATRALAFSTIAFAITFSVWGLISAVAPKFAAMYHLSPMQKSLLIAVPVLLGSIGRLPAGILADKFGGRTVFGCLLLFCLVPCILISLSNSYLSLTGWGLLLGIAGTSFSVGVAFTSKWFSANQQGTALGIYGMGNIGQSIAMFSSPVLIQATGNWRVPFWLFGGLAAIFGVIFLLFARNSKVIAKPKTMGEYLGILGREPRAWGLSLLYFLTFGCFVALSIYLPTLLVETFGLSLIDAGSRVAGFVVVATLARPMGGWLADRYGGARILLFVFGILSIVVLGLTSSNMAVFTVGALSAASLVGVENGAVFKLVPDYFPRETGTVTGLVGAAGGIGGFLPTLLLGFIKSQTGSYALGFIFLSCFALICLTVNYVLFVHKSQSAAESWTTV